MTYRVEGEEYDAVMAACRPSRPEEYDARRKAMWDRAAKTMPLPPIYPGSTYDHCAICNVEIAVGPRIQEQMGRCKAEGVEMTLVCLLDAVITSEPGTTANVISLGNPYRKQ